MSTTRQAQLYPSVSYCRICGCKLVELYQEEFGRTSSNQSQFKRPQGVTHSIPKSYLEYITLHIPSLDTLSVKMSKAISKYDRWLLGDDNGATVLKWAKHISTVNNLQFRVPGQEQRSLPYTSWNDEIIHSGNSTHQSKEIMLCQARSVSSWKI